MLHKAHLFTSKHVLHPYCVLGAMSGTKDTVMFQRDSQRRRNPVSVFPESGLKDAAVPVRADVALLYVLRVLLLEPSRQLCDPYVCYLGFPAQVEPGIKVTWPRSPS